MDASLRPDATIDSISYTADSAIRMADEAPVASATASARDPLPVVLRAALTHVERADKADKSAQDHRISAGLRFKELKERVSSGEAGKRVSWASYCAKHVPTLTQRTVDRYIAIAAGEVPNDNSTNGRESSYGEDVSDEERQRRFNWAMRRNHPGSAADWSALYRVELANYRMWLKCLGYKDSGSAFYCWLYVSDKDGQMSQSAIDKEAKYQGWLKAKGRKDSSTAFSAWISERRKAGDEMVDGIGVNPMADDRPEPSADEAPKPQSQRDPEKRREQNAKAQAGRRAKSSSIREANGGKASKPRQDRETAEQYGKLAAIAKVLDAGQLQIVNELIEERWPGTWARAEEAKAARDAAA